MKKRCEQSFFTFANKFAFGWSCRCCGQYVQGKRVAKKLADLYTSEELELVKLIYKKGRVAGAKKLKDQGYSLQEAVYIVNNLITRNGDTIFNYMGIVK